MPECEQQAKQEAFQKHYWYKCCTLLFDLIFCKNLTTYSNEMLEFSLLLFSFKHHANAIII